MPKKHGAMPSNRSRVLIRLRCRKASVGSAALTSGGEEGALHRFIIAENDLFGYRQAGESF